MNDGQDTALRILRDQIESQYGLAYPDRQLPILAKRAGAKLIIVNLGETAMDELADVFIDAKAGDVLPDIVEPG